MTLSELRYVVAVADRRHFGRAAEACHVSQPSLSVAIRKLEDELGVTLFERGRGEVSVTPAGEQIVTQARRVLTEVEHLRAVAVQSQDQLAGPLRLGAIYTIGPYLLPELIPVLRERAPRMPLVIEENYTDRLRERLKHGELDAIIISLPFEEPGVVTLPLYDEPFVAVLPGGHPLQDKKTLTLEDMADATLLMLGAGHCFRDQVLERCPACQRTVTADGSTPRNMEGSSLETIRHMVASGMGVTILPCTAVGADRYAQRLLAVRRFEDPAPSRRVALAWRTSFPRPEAIEALRQAILATALTCVDFIQPGENP
ncbi:MULTISPECIES: hydrogen peroxide-inducible genes activator [unclassified Thioalkalivibrio]|uniref:hydrogen peroxide-inducible genes activator n=1 Tax=unclassified Thioalkalivibrio TaxID=2621013 RepID=UPI00019598A7|nr:MULTISPECIES: hydrogen peroxide-inducible genes activator [unclassified Thioalkalivibrio]ADC72830.1 transcriptional regulator, LysR family [Thioalkalivibrio sp. K90mix]